MTPSDDSPIVDLLAFLLTIGSVFALAWIGRALYHVVFP